MLGGRHAEGYQIVIFVHDETGELRPDEGGELPGVLADLVVRQFHGAVQGGIGHVHQLEYLPDQGRVLQTAAHLMDVQALPLQNIGGDLLQRWMTRWSVGTEMRFSVQSTSLP